MNATEQQAEQAIRELNRAINAAENANQAGENAVVLAASTLRMTEFDRRVFTATRTFCDKTRGEDMEGVRDQMANFLCAIVEAVGTQVSNCGGDPEYLPSEDAIFDFVKFAMQDALDLDERRKERAA